MAKSFAPLVASAALFLATASAASLPNGSWPASKGTVQYKQAYIVKAGEVFDGKMKTYERSDVSCQEQTESGADTSVFKVEAGGHLKNVIIGKNQMEGVHCDKHDCIIENVWWDDVCEDALSVKGGTASSVTKVIGGGARYADDKVIQHNGFGTVEIDGFYGEDISKLYRSCGTCGNRPKTVNVKNVYVVNPTNAIVTVNKNWGDKATLKNVWVKSSKASVKVCQWSQGNANGEPKMLGNGPSPPLCQYSTSDIHINQDISKAAGQTPSQEEQNPSQEEQMPPSEGSDSVEQSASTPTPTTKGLKKTNAPKTTAPKKTKAPKTTEPVEESAEQVDQTVQQTAKNTTATVPDGTWPASTGTVLYKKPYIVKAGEVFDGKMKTYERSDVSCQEQTESGADTSVFKVEAGGHLKNVIIGKNQMEGVHCDKHDCIIENVWWDDVCEDALSVKGGTASSVTKVIGGGARYADDKVIQHNGFGTVEIDGFYGEDISKLYRSCGTCGNRPKTVNVKNVYVVNPTNAIVTVNKNWGDKATLKNVWVKSSKASVKVCQWSQGNANGEPKMLGNGPSPPLCQYSTSDIHINQDISKAAGQTPSQEEQNPSQEEQMPPSEGSDSVEQSASTPTPTTKGLKKTNAPKTTAPKKTKAPKTTEPVEESAEQVDQTVQQTEQNTTATSTVPDGSWPASKGTVKYAQAYIVKAGEVFDGKMKTYERSDVSCQEQTESGADTSVFKVEAGGHLKNVIIGKNQMEGVHCDKHDCIIENVWWDDVCEDALSVKGGTASSVTKVIGGGARYADDKVIQHNGFGTVEIDGFYGEDISKLYRSCGTCGNRPKTVNVKNVYIVDPTNAIVTVNKNWGDKATLENVWVKSSKAVKVCQWSQGNANGEPKMLGNGPSPPLCQYSESDIHINQK